MTFALAAYPRWDGRRGRTEVWYLSITETSTGMGVWIHYELVAPVVGDPYRHGWIAVFGSDDEPVCERFGPEPVGDRSADPTSWFPAAAGGLGPGWARGRAGSVAWDLTWSSDAPPLWTFPKAAWKRELLPGAQCVPVPTGSFDGTVELGGRSLTLGAARGNAAHIFGHGSARRWGWLHADLGGGDVLELVTAVSMTPGLDRLPPMAFFQLRVDGRDWPSSPLPAIRTRTELRGHEWSVAGRVGRRRIRIEVTQPPQQSVSLGYADPDGDTATCTNSEVSDAAIVVEERSGGRWVTHRAWELDGTAHAEFGTRP